MGTAKRLGISFATITTIGVVVLAFLWQETLLAFSSFGVSDPFASISSSSVTGNLSATGPAQAPSDPICVTLAQQFVTIVHLPGDVDYANPVESYWSSKAHSLLPSCIVRPRNVTQVADIVRHLNTHYKSSAAIVRQSGESSVQSKVRFAVKSGGHSPEIGFSSIDGGILIDISKMKSVEVNPEYQSVQIGAGARWGDVHPVIDNMGLMVAGGRDSHVGVGGLLLGGGVSFFSPQVGMSCDNILEYEIVLADGTITTASESNNADLWKALKGGSGNFGIVTKLTARTFPTTKVWAGYVHYPYWQSTKLINALYNFTKPGRFDKHAAIPIMAFGYIKTLEIGMHVSATQMTYTKPESWPEALKDFKSIFRFWSTAKIQTVAEAGAELSSMAPSGKRQFQVTMTVKDDLETLHGLYEVYSASLKKIKHVRGVGRCIVYQPLGSMTIHKGSSNVLGLKSRIKDESLYIVLITQSWELESDDELIESSTLELLHDMENYARARGTLDPYIYLNYAASTQDVFSSYGKENLEFLRNVSRKYDPEGFWQVAKQGGFKLGIK